jgi:hypothetical protein
MKIILNRQKYNENATIGKLKINNVEFYTLEDTKRDTKVYSKTRIPAGTYEIKLRTFGGHHEKYLKMFPEFHKGMLWLQNVPNFQDILIHIGNDPEDTKGCILVGMSEANDQFITESKKAYSIIYQDLVQYLNKGEQLFIEINDEKIDVI